MPPQAQRASLDVTAHGQSLLRRVHPQGRSQPVSVHELPESVVDALIAIEDRRFYLHPRVDPVALEWALWSNLCEGRVVSGGSTVTMQVAEHFCAPPSPPIAKRAEVWSTGNERLFNRSIWSSEF